MDLGAAIKDITVEYIKETKVGEQISKGLKALEYAQEVAYSYVTDSSSSELKTMRIGTAAAFSIINKVATGKPVKSFTEQDWKEVACNVADYAILQDGRLWSVAVFSMYANYVEISAKVLEAKQIPKDKCDAIRALAERVRNLEKDLAAGKVSEVNYTEECLWLLLEAMVKLLSTYSILVVGENAGVFIQGISALAFEYGRYTLYRQEQEILTAYLNHQEEVDDELRVKLDEYNLAMRNKQEEFGLLISNAFDPDVLNRFKATVEVAKIAGVDEREILSSRDRIDDYFL